MYLCNSAQQDARKVHGWSARIIYTAVLAHFFPAFGADLVRPTARTIADSCTGKRIVIVFRPATICTYNVYVKIYLLFPRDIYER